MAKKREIREAIANFITKVSTTERYIELKRQLLCDMNDFEPYVAFKRLTRSEDSKEISLKKISRFQSETLLHTKEYKIKRMVRHYNSHISDQKTTLSYKEFLEIVLPREHPDLRAFITQRECFDIQKGEYLSYQTEASMANLIDKEINIFSNLVEEKRMLDKYNYNAEKMVKEIDTANGAEINFSNLTEFLSDCGIAVYEFEVISFLRRLDRDDDGVVKVNELENFLRIFDIKDRHSSYSKRRVGVDSEALMTISPARKIVSGKVSLISKSRKSFVSDLNPVDTIKESSCSFKSKNFMKKTLGDSLSDFGNKSMSSFTMSSQKNEPALTVTSEINRGNLMMHKSMIGRKANNFTERDNNTIQNRSNIFKKKSSSKGKGSQAPTVSCRYDKYVNKLKEGKLGNNKEEESMSKSSYLNSCSSRFENLKDSKMILKKQMSRQIFENKGECEKIMEEGSETGNVNGRSSLAYQRSVERLHGLKRSLKMTRNMSMSKMQRTHSVSPIVNSSLKEATTGNSDRESNLKESIIESQERNFGDESGVYAEDNMYREDTGRMSDLVINVDVESRDFDQGDTGNGEATSCTDIAQYESFTPTKKLNFNINQKNQEFDVAKTPTNFKLGEVVQKGASKSQKKCKNPLQEIKLQSITNNSFKAKSSYNPIPDLRESITLTLQTSPTFKRPQSTARWGEHDSLLNIKTMGENIPQNTQEFESREWRPNFETAGLSPPNKQKGVEFTVYDYVNGRCRPPTEPKSYYTSDEEETARTGFNKIFNEDTDLHKLSSKPRKAFIKVESTKKESTQEEGTLQPKLDTFLRCVYELTQLEKKLEKHKRVLALEEEFSIKHTFDLICGYSDYQDEFGFKDIQDFLKDSGIFEHRDLIYLLEAFNYYDQDNSNTLNYNDLVEILSPVDHNLLLRITQRSKSSTDRMISTASNKKLKVVFKIIFDIFRKIKEMKQEIKEVSVSIDEIFENLDHFKRGHLNKTDFERLINRIDSEYKESEVEEIGLLVRRIDLDKDTRVNYKDFYLFFNN